MIFDRVIYPSDIITHLSDIPGMSKEAAQHLLDPMDKQNVPKAVSLIQELGKLKDIPITTNHPDRPIMEVHRHRIAFFSQFLSFFVLPFITITMSLSDQVLSLVTFGHLAAALHLKHGTACLTGALYADTQSVIKNIVITIARLQVIDPTLAFYILLEGTDRLEQLFSTVRTVDHARNFDIEQLCGKLGVAALVDAIFQRHPDLDRGHRRLSLAFAMGIDHVNPVSWRGNVCVGNVDLSTLWVKAAAQANDILVANFGSSAAVDFSGIFSKPDHDLLRPNGEYIGYRVTPNDARSEEEPTDINRGSSSNDGYYGETVAPDDSPIGLDVDDFLPDTVAGMEDQVLPPAFSHSLEINGKTYLKSSIVASLCSQRSKKATMRTLRVQGVALEDLRRSRSSDGLGTLDLDDEDVVRALDLVGVLVKCQTRICLAVMEISSFTRPSGKQTLSRVSTVSADDLEDRSAALKVVGQILELHKISGDWIWTGRYAACDVAGPDTLATRQRYILELPSFLAFPLQPVIVSAQDHGMSEREVTWKLKRDDVEYVLERAWEYLDPNSPELLSNVAILPEVANTSVLPYRDHQGAVLI